PASLLYGSSSGIARHYGRPPGRPEIAAACPATWRDGRGTLVPTRDHASEAALLCDGTAGKLDLLYRALELSRGQGSKSGNCELPGLWPRCSTSKLDRTRLTDCLPQP